MKKIEEGQSLYEVVFALAVMVLIVVAIVGVAAISVRNSSYSSNRTLAERYAQEANEWLRQERDADWKAFLVRGPEGQVKTYCMTGLSLVEKSGECNIPGTVFYREATLTRVNKDNLSSSILVYWTDAKGSHEVKLNTTLTNWKAVN